MLRKFSRYALACCLAFCVALAPYNGRAEEDYKEYLLKAAFIYNFVKFVEWPDGKAIGQQSKIDICVMGDTPLSKTGNVFTAASTSKLSLSLVADNNLKTIPDHCHVVFISRSETDHLSDILAALRSHSVLLVSDINDFAQDGGMIGFVIDDNKIKLAVNKKAATMAGMRIDAQLLEIAHEVIDK